MKSTNTGVKNSKLLTHQIETCLLKLMQFSEKEVK